MSVGCHSHHRLHLPKEMSLLDNATQPPLPSACFHQEYSLLSEVSQPSSRNCQRGADLTPTADCCLSLSPPCPCA